MAEEDSNLLCSTTALDQHNNLINITYLVLVLDNSHCFTLDSQL